MSQRQDLIIYDDNSVFSDKITNSNLSIITHNKGTSAYWLLNGLIEDGLINTCFFNTDGVQKKIDRKIDVIYISFINDSSFVARNLNKLGVDANNSNFHFVDCFTDLFNQITSTNYKRDIEKLFEKLSQKVKSTQSGKKIVIIDSPEILLYTTPISSIELIFKLNKLISLSTQTYISIPLDNNLVDSTATNASTIEFKLTDFLVRLHHKSSLNIRLKPLDTGRANDITGCLTVSRGAVPYDKVNVIEKEYLYLVEKENSIKLFFR